LVYSTVEKDLRGSTSYTAIRYLLLKKKW